MEYLQEKTNRFFIFSAVLLGFLLEIGLAAYISVSFSTYQKERKTINSAVRNWEEVQEHTQQFLISSGYSDTFFKDWLDKCEQFQESLNKLSKLNNSKEIFDENSSIGASPQQMWSITYEKIQYITKIAPKQNLTPHDIFPLPGNTAFSTDKKDPLQTPSTYVIRSYIHDVLSLNAPFRRMIRNYFSELEKDMENRILFSSTGSILLSFVLLTGILIFIFSSYNQLSKINKQLLLEIQERSKTQIELKKAKQEAESANNAKTEFLAKVSHELRTPLNGIIGFTEIIRETHSEQPEISDYTAKILHESEKLLFLVNDLLDLTKMETGNFTIAHEPFSLTKLLNDIIDFGNRKINKKKLWFHSYSDSNLPNAVIGDYHRVYQILVNIIGNSTKFTKTGIIKLSAFPINADETHYTIGFSIEDTGIGIAKTKQKYIFDAFYQVEATKNRKHSGSGLGIAIAKSLSKMMGGTIRIQSQEGVGSTFFISLKLRIPTTQEKKIIEEAEFTNLKQNTASFDSSLSDMQILVVEDYEPNLEIVKNIVEYCGFTVFSAKDGEEAVQKYQERHFDLILMDIQMPGMNGLEATRKIRRLEDANQRIPIIGLSAHAYTEDKNQCLQAGMDDYLAKPIRKHDLLQKIKNIISDSNQYEKEPLQSKNPENYEPDNGITDNTTPNIASEKNKKAPPLDIDIFAEELGDTQLAYSLIHDFLAQTKEQIPRIKNCLKQADYQTLHREAHSIAGGAMNVYAGELREKAKSLETAGKNKKNADIPYLISEVETEIERIKEFITK